MRYNYRDMEEVPKVQNSGVQPKLKWKTRVLHGEFPDRQFDIDFWQEQGGEAIWDAAYGMIEAVEEMKYGRKPTLQRTVTRVKRRRS